MIRALRVAAISHVVARYATASKTLADLHSGGNPCRDSLDEALRVLDDEFPELSAQQRKVILRDIPRVAAARAMGGNERTIKDGYTKDLERCGKNTLTMALKAFRKAYDAFAVAAYYQRMSIAEAYATVAEANNITVDELHRLIASGEKRAAKDVERLEDRGARADMREAKIEMAKPAPARLTAKERAAFKDFALQPENIWSETDFKRLWPDGSAGMEFQECGLSPSEFIARKFKLWLDTGRLWLEDITAIQEKLSGAYSVETTEKRHPERRLPQLYVRPHRLPAGAPRAQRKLIAEMSDEEAERERERSKINTRNYRARKKVAEPA